MTPISLGISRRTKSTRACDKCRSLRKRCDGAKPCTSCTSLRVQCKYTEVDGRKKEEFKARIEALEKRNQYLEEQIEHLKCNQGPGQNDTLKRKRPLRESSPADGEPRLASTFASTSAAAHPDKQADKVDQVDHGLEHMFFAATANHPLLNSLNPLSGSSDRNMRDQLPEEHLTRYALDAFFQCAATLFYVTTEDNAAQLMKKVYHTNDASILDICELSALAAIGSYYIIDKVDDAARARYFFLATTNLNEAVQAYDIQGLRILICLCMSCIMDKSLSARLLVMSGLNLARARTEAETERSESNGKDVLEYRRTLQTVLFFEGWLSWSLGYRNCLKESELNLVRKNIPQRTDFTDFKSFTTCLIQYTMTKLALIGSEIQNEIVSSPQDYWSHANPLSVKLDRWYQELPAELHLAALSRIEEEMTLTELQKRGTYMMHLLYIDSRLQLCCQLLNAAQTTSREDPDPFFLQALCRSVPEQFFDIHTGFAIQLAKILCLMFTNQAIMTRCWVVMRSAFDTCIVLLLGVCHKYFTASGTCDLSEILSHVDSCFQVLCFCASHDVAAKRLRDLIGPVHAQLRRMSSRAGGRDGEVTQNILRVMEQQEKQQHAQQQPEQEQQEEDGQQQRLEPRDGHKMTIGYLLDGKASEALTLVGMTHHLLKFMPPHKWDIWI
ncbi:hypothetical protein BJX66DRAFT_335854 [Aspergillus keveii]|uniref:Zn(2)-C6 fungal-type domain-containing protein n=1 Tax=Aspergillus keveii TaxID=714993 RepID=A0ABR4GC56_9EURO